MAPSLAFMPGRAGGGLPALGRWTAIAAAALVLAGCRQGVLDPQGPVAGAQRLILLNATVIMLAIVLPVMAMTLAFAWWFRAGNARALYRPDWEYSGRLEFLVWSIPAMTVFFLAGIAWIGSHELDPPKPIASDRPAVEIEVVSLDWKWLFIYPGEGVASVNRLVVPVGAPLSFRLTSTGVMNSFFVPQLGSQIYTMAGMTTRLNLLADRPGTFPGFSAQYSGPGFADMRFDTLALPVEGFRDWVARAKGGGGELDAKRFDELVRPSKADPPATFAGVAPDLFRSIVERAGADAPSPVPPAAPDVRSDDRARAPGAAMPHH